MIGFQFSVAILPGETDFHLQIPPGFPTGREEISRRCALNTSPVEKQEEKKRLLEIYEFELYQGLEASSVFMVLGLRQPDLIRDGLCLEEPTSSAVVAGRTVDPHYIDGKIEGWSVITRACAARS